MGKAAWIFSFKLRKNVLKEEFIEATKKLHDNVVSKAEGFISWEQYRQGDTWTDFVLWESIEDANNAITVGEGRKEAEKFYSMIQMNTCKTLVSSFEKKY